MSYSRTSGESNHHRQSVSDTRVSRYQLHHEDDYFLYLFFRREITEIDRAVIPSEVVRLEPYPPQFLIWTRSPAPLPTLEKNKIMIFCRICTLIFVSGGKGGCRACHMHLCQLKSPRGGRLDGFYFCLSFRRVYFWARKSQKKLDTQIRAFPVQDACDGCCLC